MRVAHIQSSDDTIINIDDDARIPFAEGFYKVPVSEIEGEVFVGFRYDPETKTASFVEPATDVPEAVTARQARLALLGADKLAMVEGALAQIPGVEGEAARIEWEYALEIRRDSPLIGALAPMLGLTDAQVDDLFRAAEGL